MDHSQPFKWRHFQAEIILLCIRWYLRYALSYRDLEELMLERGLHIDHTTIFRWVQAYARSWKNAVGLISKLAPTRGKWMKRTSK
jgi:transposase, IS6 family